MAKPICAECEKDGKQYQVFAPMGGMTTCMAYTPGYWDESGKYVENKDPNITTYTYECSNGHSWSETTGGF